MVKYSHFNPFLSTLSFPSDHMTLRRKAPQWQLTFSVWKRGQIVMWSFQGTSPSPQKLKQNRTKHKFPEISTSFLQPVNMQSYCCLIKPMLCLLNCLHRWSQGGQTTLLGALSLIWEWPPSSLWCHKGPVFWPEWFLLFKSGEFFFFFNKNTYNRWANTK